MAKKGTPKLPDVETLIRAGIDPITRQPTRVVNKKKVKENLKRSLRIIDEQDAVNRYKWYNLPLNISSQELERLLYYKGQLCFFYEKNTEEFYIMPFALDGTIDFYGRYNTIHPIPFATGGTKEEKHRVKQLAAYLSTLKLKVIYGIPTDPEVYKHPEEYTVILWDYTKQLGENIIPRQEVNDCYVELESDIISFLRTSLLQASGIKGMRVNNADEAENVQIASQQVEASALNSELWIAVEGATEFQDLANNPVARSQDFLIALQSIDNQRLATYGLDNGGIFQKAEHQLERENAMNTANNGIVYQDGLDNRQNFCDILNALWGFGIDCLPKESAIEADLNGDGIDIDQNEGQTGTEVVNNEYENDSEL